MRKQASVCELLILGAVLSSLGQRGIRCQRERVGPLTPKSTPDTVSQSTGCWSAERFPWSCGAGTACGTLGSESRSGLKIEVNEIECRPRFSTFRRKRDVQGSLCKSSRDMATTSPHKRSRRLRATTNSRTVIGTTLRAAMGWLLKIKCFPPSRARWILTSQNGFFFCRRSTT